MFSAIASVIRSFPRPSNPFRRPVRYYVYSHPLVHGRYCVAGRFSNQQEVRDAIVSQALEYTAYEPTSQEISMYREGAGLKIHMVF